MDTHFAPAKKADNEQLATEINIVSASPVVTGLLQSISGLLAVIDEHRQIVALNDTFLQTLGIDDSAEALGLRPGEAFQCVHAQEQPSGCGTTKFCSSCGAAIAMVSCMELDKPVERICSIKATRGDTTVDIVLHAKAHPITINEKTFLLLYLQDITQQQKRAALERTFFHDVNNMLSMLVGASELLMDEHPSELAKTVYEASIRLTKEVAIQRCLSQSDSCDYSPIWLEHNTNQILNEVESFFSLHPVSSEKIVHISNQYPTQSFKTDISLLLRVLYNMVTNALEATNEGGKVDIWLEQNEKYLSFFVWNEQAVPEEALNRVFQRNYSTKGQAGRGIGTYSMKLLGENILGGQVSFVTSEQKGTTFKFDHPL